MTAGAPTRRRDDAQATLNDTEQVLIAAVREHEGVSRSRLASFAGLPLSTVSTVARRLVAQGLLAERDSGESTGGRRPKLLYPMQSEGLVYAAELGTTHARVGLLDMEGDVLFAEEVPLDVQAGPEATMDLLIDHWQRLTVPASQRDEVKVIGLAVPGPVDSRGCVTGAARLPGWGGFALGEAIRARTGLPTVVENDARAGALGEWLVHGQDTSSWIYVKAGRGVGAGWISGGRLQRGSDGFAGDITHIRVHSDQELRTCSCGNKGCLETLASGAALLRRLSEEGREMTNSSDLVTAVGNGDPHVTALVREAGGRLGEVLSSLVNFLNPGRIVIGGSLSQMETFIAGTRSEIYDRCLPISTARLVIEASRTGADSSIIGLSSLAHRLVN